MACCSYITELSRSGRNDVITWIYLLDIKKIVAVQTLLITVQMPTIYSRDELLRLRAGATLLNHDQRLTITQLGLRRRGGRSFTTGCAQCDVIDLQHVCARGNTDSQNLPYGFGNSRTIWDHTVLPATQQRCPSRFYPRPKLVLDLATPEGARLS